MEKPIDHKFINEINQNTGIAHKVCNIYFIDSHDREDVFQEMMYQLWRAYPGFQRNSKFSTWMYRVCLNTALTYLKRNKKNRYEALSIKHHQIAEEKDIRQNEDMLLLYKAIDGLTPINKATILLYLENLSYEEIAQITGLSKSNVSVRIVRIKKELEKELTKINKKEDAKFG